MPLTLHIGHPADADLLLADAADLADWRAVVEALPPSGAAVVSLLPPLPPGLSLPGALDVLRELRPEAELRVYVASAALRDGLQARLDARVAEPWACQVGRLRVRVVQGDLIRTPADAIVNASNAALRLGDGVSGAIRDAARPTLQAELSALAARRPLGHGEVVVTGAHGLPQCRWIFHAATVLGAPEVVESGLRAALAACEGVGARSVAVPALGTGVGRFDLAACAGVFAAVLAEVGGQPGRLPEEVMIILRTADAHAVFVDALGALGS